MSMYLNKLKKTLALLLSKIDIESIDINPNNRQELSITCKQEITSSAKVTINPSYTKDGITYNFLSDDGFLYIKQFSLTVI